MLKKFARRFYHARHGLYYALTHDESFRQQILLGLVVITLLISLLFPLTVHDALFLFLAWFMIMITELQNSAIEAALDRLHPELHDSIKQSKDMAAGAVLLAGLFLLLVVGTITYTRFLAPLLGW